MDDSKGTINSAKDEITTKEGEDSLKERFISEEKGSTAGHNRLSHPIYIEVVEERPLLKKGEDTMEEVTTRIIASQIG
jgi:hypothetical protein